jgi:hypothetical protein
LPLGRPLRWQQVVAGVHLDHDLLNLGTADRHLREGRVSPWPAWVSRYGGEGLAALCCGVGDCWNVGPGLGDSDLLLRVNRRWGRRRRDGWRGGGGAWRRPGEGLGMPTQSAGQEGAWFLDAVRPGPPRLAHVGVERVDDLAGGPQVRVDAGTGEGIAEGADVATVQAVAAIGEFGGEALDGQSSGLGAPAPLFVGWIGFRARVRAFGELLPAGVNRLSLRDGGRRKSGEVSTGLSAGAGSRRETRWYTEGRRPMLDVLVSRGRVGASTAQPETRKRRRAAVTVRPPQTGRPRWWRG